MYQLNDMDNWRDHHRQLLREAEEGRLARQLGPTHRKRRQRSFAGAMRRRAALLFSVMGLAMLLVAGAAYAEDIQCELPAAGDICLGTEAPDVMLGTRDFDHIAGLDDDDEIHGLTGSDRLTGDGNFTVPGDDELFGGPGFDTLFGGAGSDQLAGGKDADQISADFLLNDGTDTVKGGAGNDTVNTAERVTAPEGAKDIIDCGRGDRDRVEFDAGIDVVKNCEIKDAI